MKNVILGIGMLRKNKAYIDFEENTITFPEHEVVCPLLKGGRKYLKTTRKIAIPPKQIRTFSVKLKGINSGDMLMIDSLPLSDK